MPLEDLLALSTRELADRHLLAPSAALPHLPAFELDDAQGRDLARGRKPEPADLGLERFAGLADGQRVKLASENSGLFGLATVRVRMGRDGAPHRTLGSLRLLYLGRPRRKET
jgi:hypothetical protein